MKQIKNLPRIILGRFFIVKRALYSSGTYSMISWTGQFKIKQRVSSVLSVMVHPCFIR